jgi:hypothetical protein
MLMVMNVALRGERVQYVRRNIQDAWKDIPPGFTEWNWALYDYRIAPEPRKPREWWIKEGEWMQIPYSKGEEPMRQRFAEGLVYEVPMANTIHVREVLPE